MRQTPVAESQQSGADEGTTLLQRQFGFEALLSVCHQSNVSGPPLNGPTIFDVIQPP